MPKILLRRRPPLPMTISHRCRCRSRTSPLQPSNRQSAASWVHRPTPWSAALPTNGRHRHCCITDSWWPSFLVHWWPLIPIRRVGTRSWGKQSRGVLNLFLVLDWLSWVPAIFLGDEISFIIFQPDWPLLLPLRTYYTRQITRRFADCQS